MLLWFRLAEFAAWINIKVPNLAIQLAIHPWLTDHEPRFVAEFQNSLKANPPSFSISVSRAPFGPGDLAVLVDAPVLPVCLDAHEALCAPLYIPGRAACPACLEHWLVNAMYERPVPSIPLDDFIGQVVYHKIAHWSSIFSREGRVPDLERDAVSLSYNSAKMTRHPIFPRRDCANCNQLHFEIENTPRIHCSRWTGIINQMEVSTESSAGAFRASASWSPPVPVNQSRPHLKRMESYGRGRTRKEAEVGCIGEALERYSLIYRGDESLVRARLRDVDAIHPNRIQLFSDAQFDNREAWNQAADEDLFVPERFDPEESIEWLVARPLGSATEKLVAAACCLMWYSVTAGGREFARADTVGCGTGRTADDALIHALLECIERDAMAIWWENRLRRPAIRIESFESPEVKEASEGLRAIGRNLRLLDCTTDLGIPVYIAVAPRLDGSEPLFAGAAHFSAKIAAYKAASEVGQVWSVARMSGALPAGFQDWILKETLDRQPFLSPSAWVDAPQESAVTEGQAIAYVVDRLESCGLHAYAVDHSRADVLWPTVRAIVPGLRHIWNRRAAGRLYDVPVKMGWMSAPLAEDDLNPIRCMI